jgi:hypothetical protein
MPSFGNVRMKAARKIRLQIDLVGVSVTLGCFNRIHEMTEFISHNSERLESLRARCQLMWYLVRASWWVDGFLLNESSHVRRQKKGSCLSHPCLFGGYS